MLPAFTKQYAPDGTDGKHLNSINCWYKKEKARLQSLVNKQKLGHLSHRKVGAVSARFCAFKWRRLARPPLLTQKRAGRIRDGRNKTARLIINSCLSRKIARNIMFCWNREQKLEIYLGKRRNQNFAQIKGSLPPREGKGTLA